MPGLSDLAPMPEPIDARPVAQRVARRRRVQGAVTLGLVAAVVTALVILVPRVGGTTSEPAGTSATPSATDTRSANRPSVVQRTAGPSTKPWTTPPIAKPGQRVAAAGIIVETVGSSGGMMLCSGVSAEATSRDGCTIPVSGLSWADLPGNATETRTPEASASAQPSPVTQTVSQFTVVEGMWDGQRLQVTALVEADTGGRAWMTAYGYPDPGTFADSAPFCTPETTDPARGTTDAGYAAAEKLATFEAGYMGTDDVLNVFVTQDVPGATQAIRAVYGGPLCVGLGRGITQQQSTAAMNALFDAQERLGSSSVGVAPDRRGVVVEVHLVILTPEIHQQALTLAGPAAPALRFLPELYPVP